MATVSQKPKAKRQKLDSEVKLPKEIFGARLNSALVHQVVTGYLSNLRQSTSSTKTRGEVSGGGRKPWRQKGTGRARHGSNRSPIWIGGGITFGPSPERNFKKTLPKALRLGALAQVFSDRKKNNKLIITPTLEITNPKTKIALALLKKSELSTNTLFVTTKQNNNLYKACRNVPSLHVSTAQDVTALDAIKHEYIVIEKPAVAALIKRYGVAQ